MNQHHIIRFFKIQSSTFSSYPWNNPWHVVWHRRLVRSQFSPSDTTIKYVNKSGVVKFKGSSTLKSSQTYPSKFGKAVARLELLFLNGILLFVWYQTIRAICGIHRTSWGYNLNVHGEQQIGVDYWCNVYRCLWKSVCIRTKHKYTCGHCIDDHICIYIYIWHIIYYNIYIYRAW